MLGRTQRTPRVPCILLTLTARARDKGIGKSSAGGAIQRQPGLRPRTNNNNKPITALQKGFSAFFEIVTLDLLDRHRIHCTQCAAKVPIIALWPGMGKVSLRRNLCEYVAGLAKNCPTSTSPGPFYPTTPPGRFADPFSFGKDISRSARINTVIVGRY